MEPHQGLFGPVRTRLVRPEWATRVVSPAYDALTPAQRLALMERDPYVFLHVTRSESADPTRGPAEVLEDNAAALVRLLDADVFGPVNAPALYLYRLELDGHTQVGIVGDLAVNDKTDAMVLPHERTRPQRAAVLADHLERVRANSSAVALTHRPDPALAALVGQVLGTTPILRFEREDRLKQTVWRVPETLQPQVSQALNAHTLYIVDGHHRMAAAHEYRRRIGQDTKLLVAVFPSDQLRVAAFQRRVSDVRGLTVASLVQAIANTGLTIEPAKDRASAQPRDPGAFGMYIDGQWFRIVDPNNDLSVLDATTLQQAVLGPILQLEDGADARLEFLPGEGGLDRLTQHATDQGGVVFSLYPVLLDQLMTLVDSGKTLPPKSTYFQPKVRSGVFLTPR